MELMIWKRGYHTLSNRGLVTGSHEPHKSHHGFCILLSLTLYFTLSTFCKRKIIISVLYDLGDDKRDRKLRNMNNIWKRTLPGAQAGTESAGTRCLAFIKPTEAVPSEGSLHLHWLEGMVCQALCQIHVEDFRLSGNSQPGLCSNMIIPPVPKDR